MTKIAIYKNFGKQLYMHVNTGGNITYIDAPDGLHIHISSEWYNNVYFGGIHAFLVHNSCGSAVAQW